MRPNKLKPSLPTSCCPSCRYEMTEATGVSPGARSPHAGDLSVCLNCGAILQFNDILVLKPISDDDFSALPPRLRLLLEGASRLIKERGTIVR
jgi:hypothetical protein